MPGRIISATRSMFRKSWTPTTTFQWFIWRVIGLNRFVHTEPCNSMLPERHEQAHKPNLKHSWNASNHNLNYLPQVITLQCRIVYSEIRAHNLQALAQYRENSTAACNVHPSGADLAAPRSSQSYVKPEFMGPQNCGDGYHSDAIIKQFRALLDNTQVAKHCVAIYSSTQEFVMHNSYNQPYISDEQLHAMELCIYPGINVQVEGLEGERIPQMCRWTESQSCPTGYRRNDWVWVKYHPEWCYRTLNGCLPW